MSHFNCRRVLRRIFPFCCIIGLAGCASLSKDECAVANWRQIGLTDAINGYSAARLDDHAKACSEYGIRPQLDAYLQGRAQGLRSYCQSENGFNLGRNGRSHIAGDCPADLKGAFLEEYRRGTQIRTIESDIAWRRTRIEENYRQMHQKNERIGTIKRDLSRADITADRRGVLLSEFNLLVDQKDSLARDNRHLESEVGRIDAQLQQTLRDFGR